MTERLNPVIVLSQVRDESGRRNLHIRIMRDSNEEHIHTNCCGSSDRYNYFIRCRTRPVYFTIFNTFVVLLLLSFLVWVILLSQIIRSIDKPGKIIGYSMVICASIPFVITFIIKMIADGFQYCYDRRRRLREPETAGDETSQ
jgi:hypothetical protein